MNIECATLVVLPDSRSLVTVDGSVEAHSHLKQQCRPSFIEHANPNDCCRNKSLSTHTPFYEPTYGARPTTAALKGSMRAT